MALENVKAFYERLGSDASFRNQIQKVKNKAECSKIVKAAGYDFSEEEFQEFTAQVLELSSDDSQLQEVDEKELATILGGIAATQIYGNVWPKEFYF